MGVALLRLTGPFDFWILAKDDLEDEFENETEGPAGIDAGRPVAVMGPGKINDRLTWLEMLVALFLVPPRIGAF